MRLSVWFIYVFAIASLFYYYYCVSVSSLLCLWSSVPLPVLLHFFDFTLDFKFQGCTLFIALPNNCCKITFKTRFSVKLH